MGDNCIGSLYTLHTTDYMQLFDKSIKLRDEERQVLTEAYHMHVRTELFLAELLDAAITPQHGIKDPWRACPACAIIKSNGALAACMSAHLIMCYHSWKNTHMAACMSAHLTMCYHSWKDTHMHAFHGCMCQAWPTSSPRCHHHRR